jgi:hypothetical protein
MHGDLQHHCTFASLDLPLFMLFIHGGIAVGWVAALSVFSTGVVPIYFCMSQFGFQHQAITNVIITGVATKGRPLKLSLKSGGTMPRCLVFDARDWAIHGHQFHQRVNERCFCMTSKEMEDRSADAGTLLPHLIWLDLTSMLQRYQKNTKSSVIFN